MWSKRLSKNSQAGMSIIEIIVAVGLFVIIAGGATITVLSAFSSTRLAKEELQATLLAEEGLEAVQSLRNQDWDNLSAGTYGLSQVGGSWSFSGSSDIDPSGKFTRVVILSQVERDGNGKIVSSGGTVDDQTFLVEVAASWDFTPTRNNTVEMSQYLTDWQLAVGAGSDGTGTGGVTTCAEYCADQSYSTGTCRANTNQCNQNGETYEAGGDTYCSDGGGSDTCCCAP